VDNHEMTDPLPLNELALTPDRYVLP
jgi:hypothetical protein